MWQKILGVAVVTLGVLLLVRKDTRKVAPLQGKITSKFGNRIHPITLLAQFHNGTDIAASEGTKIVAPSDGTVVDISTQTAGGNQLIIQHTDNTRTGYAHLKGYAVKKEGERVKKGQTIAYVGKTGQVTGAHLHFTYTVGGTKVDPEKYFKFS
jgi:murein DD-endopeptidase MepM/ murein hydrolase activator NlpD